MDCISIRVARLSIGTIACLDLFLNLSKFTVWTSDPEKARANVVRLDNPKHNFESINQMRHTIYPIIEMVISLVVAVHCFYPRIYRFSLRRRKTNPSNENGDNHQDDRTIAYYEEFRMARNKVVVSSMLAMFYVLTVTMGATFMTKVLVINILDWVTLGFDVLLLGMLIFLTVKHANQALQLVNEHYGGGGGGGGEGGSRSNSRDVGLTVHRPRPSREDRWRSQDSNGFGVDTLPLYEEYPKMTVSSTEDARIDPSIPPYTSQPLTPQGHAPPYSQVVH